MRRILVLLSRGRFSIRAAMLIVAMMAIALTAYTIWVPGLIRRIQVGTLVRQRLSTPYPQGSAPASSLQFKYYFALSTDDYKTLTRDPEYTVSMILSAIETETDDERRLTALDSLHRYLGDVPWDRAGVPAVAALSKLALNSSEADSIRSSALTTLSRWIIATGLSPAERSALLRGAQRELRSPPKDTDARQEWIRVLAVLGGDEERALLMEFAGDPDVEIRRSVRLALAQARISDVLTKMLGWIDEDKNEIDDFLGSPVVRDTREGHEFLLSVAMDFSREQKPRQSAVNWLQRSVDGKNRLREVLNNKFLRENYGLGKLAETSDHYLWMRSENEMRKTPNRWIQFRLKAKERVASLQHLILQLDEDDQIKSGFWEFDGTTSTQVMSAEGVGPIRAKERADQARAVLQHLTGRKDLFSQEQRLKWKQNQRNTPPISQRAWLDAVVEMPDSFGAVVIPEWIEARSTIPEELVPLYEQLANSPFPDARFIGAKSLLLRANRPDMVPVLIDLIQQESKKPPGRRSTEAIELLRECFGQNFLWDVRAWKSWWFEYEWPPKKAPATFP